VAEAVSGLERHVQAKRHELVGIIRVTCPEPLALRIAKTQLLDRFHARHPGLRVEWVMSDKYLDIARGDADVALRSGDVEDSELVGRKVADSLWGVYASRQYLEQHGRPECMEDLGQHDIVRLRRVHGQSPNDDLAAGGGAGRQHRGTQQQRARPALLGEGRRGHRGSAHAAGQR
jgi:DNA-binding transcriptional LysR family regulator